ncbi:MAG TPA: hypothetical protein VJG83_00590 [archaeon]|nr:hypothetical protein [archaeon]
MMKKMKAFVAKTRTLGSKLSRSVLRKANRVKTGIAIGAAASMIGGTTREHFHERNKFIDEIQPANWQGLAVPTWSPILRHVDKRNFKVVSDLQQKIQAETVKILKDNGFYRDDFWIEFRAGPTHLNRLRYLIHVPENIRGTETFNQLEKINEKYKALYTDAVNNMLDNLQAYQNKHGIKDGEVFRHFIKHPPIAPIEYVKGAGKGGLYAGIPLALVGGLAQAGARKGIKRYRERRAKRGQ